MASVRVYSVVTHEWKTYLGLLFTSTHTVEVTVGQTQLHTVESDSSSPHIMEQQQQEQALRFAVIGCGYWGKNYVRLLRQHPETVCAWCCDASAETLGKIRGAYGDMNCASSVEELLSVAKGQIDAVVVALPASSHFDHVVPCLESGLHVLVEKPMALSSEHCAAMAAAAEKHQRCLLVGHTFVYNDRLAIAIDMMKREAIRFGDLHTMYSKRTNLGPIRKDTSVLWDLAAHDISIFQFIMKKLPTYVSCNTHRVMSDHADVGFIALSYEGGIMAHVHVSWLDPQKGEIDCFRWIGSKDPL